MTIGRIQRPAFAGGATTAWTVCTLLLSTHAVAAESSRTLELLKDVKARWPSGQQGAEHRTKRWVRQVRINADVFKRSRISIVLYSGKEIVATRKSGRAGPTESHWLGEVEGHRGSTVAITRRRGTIAGSIRFENELFEIARISNGRYIIFEVDQSSLPSKCSPVPVHRSMLAEVINNAPLQGGGEQNVLSNPLPVPAVQTAASGQDAEIDLMVVYTAASRKRHGRRNLEAQIANAVVSTNQAYRNSGIPATLRLVRMAEVGYVESGMSQSLSHMQNASDGRMDQIHAWRDRYRADLVSLVSEDRGACGRAYTMTVASDAFSYFAFSVIRSDCLSSHTLAHELGHNQGGAHNRENAGRRLAYPYAFGHRRCAKDGTGFRTIMAYPCARAKSINSFSSPSILYQGFPTGIDHQQNASQSADNALALRNTAKIVASFRTAIAAQRPKPPSHLSARAVSGSSIKLGYRDRSDNESAFWIERATGGTSWRQIGQVGANVKSFTDRGLKARTRYRYRVRAGNNKGRSGYTNEATATTLSAGSNEPPKAPSNLAVTAVSSSSIQLRWKDNSNNESFFQVDRKEGSQAWILVNTTKAGVSTFNDRNLKPSKLYRYRVRSGNAHGRSAYSNQVASMTRPKVSTETPRAPSHLSATVLSRSSIRLKWRDNSNNEAAFKVYRMGAGESWRNVRVVRPNQTVFDDIGLKPGTTYRYRISALNVITGESGNSNEAAAITRR